MTDKVLLERRDFLKKAAQGTLAAPMLALLPSLGEAQEPKKPTAAAPIHKAVAPVKPKVVVSVKDRRGW